MKSLILALSLAMVGCKSGGSGGGASLVPGAKTWVITVAAANGSIQYNVVCSASLAGIDTSIDEDSTLAMGESKTYQVSGDELRTLYVDYLGETDDGDGVFGTAELTISLREYTGSNDLDKSVDPAVVSGPAQVRTTIYTEADGWLL